MPRRGCARPATRGIGIAGAIVQRRRRRADRQPLRSRAADRRRGGGRGRSCRRARCAALEVAAAGASVERALPTRCGWPTCCASGPTRHARRATPRARVAGRRTALVVREAGMAGSAAEAIDTTVRLAARRRHDRGARRARRAATAGRVTALRGAAGAHEQVLDAFWCRLPGAARGPGLRRRLQRRRALALALLARGDSSDLLERARAADARRGAGRRARESLAAVLRRRHDAACRARRRFVIDIGGGTVDLHREGRRGRHRRRRRARDAHLPGPARRRARLGRARQAPPQRARRDAVRAPPRGRLAAASSASPRRRSALAPPVRARRRPARAACRARSRPRSGAGCAAARSRRVLAATSGARSTPRAACRGASSCTLVGGCASDPEVIDAVAAELGDLDVAVARGNVLGRHGPRAAVAVGLVLAYAAGS